MSDNTPVIRLLTYEPRIFTPEDFEEMCRDVKGRFFAGDKRRSDDILIQLIHEHYGRYHEVCTRIDRPPDPDAEWLAAMIAEARSIQKFERSQQ